MRENFKKKLACLLFVIVFTFTTIAGCGGSSDELKDKLTDNDVALSSGEQTTASDDAAEEDTSLNDESVSGESEVSESASDGQSESTGMNVSSDSATTNENDENDSETTSVNPSDESKSVASDSSNESETTTKKQDTSTIGKQDTSTTGKQDTSTTKKEKDSTTEKQEASTTKKQEATIQKPAEQETTTKKETSSTGGSSGSSSSGSALTTAEQMAKSIVDSIITSGMSDFQKAIAIHDWLTYNLDYDFTYSRYYVEETLRDRTCVCQGYALTFQMMCELAGLEATFVSGTGTNSSGQTESHAWNQVKIDGVWYNVDVTWDDPTSPGKDFNDHSANGYDYFLISDAKINKNHTATSSKQTCSSDYDAKSILKYAANSGVNPKVAYAENATDFATAVQKFFEAGKTDMVLWYYDTTVTSDNMWNVLWKLLEAAPVTVGYNPSYAPVNGMTKYILTIPVKAEWNSIPVVTSSAELASLINTNFAAGNTTFQVRYEPADGVINFSGASYAYSFTYSSIYYNSGKSVLLTIMPSS